MLEPKNLRKWLQSADPRAPRWGLDWWLTALARVERDRSLARRLPVVERVERDRSLARQLPAARPALVTGSTADSADSGPDGTSGPVHCGATAQRPATTATSWPLGGRHHCKIGSADGLAERIPRTL
jgi:hypothetical protein